MVVQPQLGVMIGLLAACVTGREIEANAQKYSHVCGASRDLKENKINKNFPGKFSSANSSHLFEILQNAFTHRS